VDAAAVNSRGWNCSVPWGRVRPVAAALQTQGPAQPPVLPNCINDHMIKVVKIKILISASKVVAVLVPTVCSCPRVYALPAGRPRPDITSLKRYAALLTRPQRLRASTLGSCCRRYTGCS
jgi:hypothetical protein